MIELARGDILNCEVDAVVLSAHPTLVAGSGMSGHFHRQAGPELEETAHKLGPLEPGNSVVTDGFNLRTTLVVHAVAPRYIKKSEQEKELLRQTYQSVLSQPDLTDIESIAFPAIGVGIYGWPIDLSASIAMSVLAKSPFKRTIVCLYDDENYESYRKLLI
jgi:O-acetyl-ADP-ribose deacetylase (regulator of RNase III)